ncbi:MAG: amidohydrolase family protein [Planctomycetes bacterium]|nr:amidohydrolase family protein [Planctomycetota bacterium]
MTKLTAYRGHILSARADGEWDDWPDGLVSVDAAGTICAAGPWKLRRETGRVVDLRPHVILPGFVDTHAHIPQMPACGAHGESLLRWLRTWIYPLEAAFRGERARAGAEAFFREMLAEGITTAALYASAWPDGVDACFAAAKKAGVRALIGPPLMDVESYRDDLRRARRRTERVLSEAAVLCRTWHQPRGRLRFAFTPRFALSCTPELMAGAAELAARYDAPVQTHLAENREETRLVEKRFGSRYLEVYRRCGLVRPGAIFAHAIWLDDGEWRALGDAGASVAHCPSSNLFLRSGTMRWRAGARVGLGSDVGAGPSLSPFDVMRASIATGACTDPAALLRAATREGAAALGFPGGCLEAGQPADFVVLDRGIVVPPGGPDLENTRDLISRIVHRCNRAAVSATYVDGELRAGATGPVAGRTRSCLRATRTWASR